MPVPGFRFTGFRAAEGGRGQPSRARGRERSPSLHRVGLSGRLRENESIEVPVPGFARGTGSAPRRGDDREEAKDVKDTATP